MSTQDARLWAIALAFDEQHGEAGPRVFAAMLAELRKNGKTEEAEELRAIAVLLEQMHRAGSRDRQ